MKEETMRVYIAVAVLIAVCVGSAVAEDSSDRRLGRRREGREERRDDRVGSEETVVVTAPVVASTTVDVAAEIPANTSVLVKMDSPLDSSKHGEGHRFTGTLQADIVSDGALIAAQGSKVHGQIISAEKSRRTVGQSSLSLKVTGIMAGTQLRPIESATVTVASAKTGGDSLRKVARGAAVGGLADGSEGAEVGIKVGAAASLVSKGQTAAIAAGSVLEFIIGAPGSGVASKVSEDVTQPRETSGDRRDDRRRDRR
jgi:hypothetical protein